MYKIIIAIITILCLLTGCTAAPAPSVPQTTGSAADTIPSTQAVTEPVEETTEAATEPAEETTEAATEPAEETTEATDPSHSALYIPYVAPEEMVTYFLEVCLDAEFVHSGNAGVLQRWEAPICYRLHGEPTDKDRQVVEAMAQWLNTVEGFPGMWEADDSSWPNMNIYFCDQAELLDRMGDHLYDLDGAFTFWYDYNIIYDCTICIRTDLDQYLRNSVILEEIYNSLGPAQDTDLRQESIAYAGFSQPQALHPIDEVILELLYHPSLACGMDPAQCEQAILALYY